MRNVIWRIINFARNKRRLYDLTRKGNRIHSNNVALSAIIGQKINVMKGAFIDQHCEVNSYTYIGHYSRISKARIGRYCSIASYVSIGEGEHSLQKISTSALFYDNSYSLLTQNDCTIKNDVWIGTQSIIRRGVTIGNGAVIGANSFVNADVPDFAVVVGSPARVVKNRFSPDEIDIIRATRWWDEELDTAKHTLSDLESQLHTLRKSR